MMLPHPTQIFKRPIIVGYCRDKKSAVLFFVTGHIIMALPVVDSQDELYVYVLMTRLLLCQD